MMGLRNIVVVTLIAWFCLASTAKSGEWAPADIGLSPNEDLEECKTNSNCRVDQFCLKQTGDCDGLGECSPYPDLCQNIWMPVCGCDGQTYSNACYAHRAGVNVAHDGPCGAGGTCLDNDDCGVYLYCAKEPGDCDGMGVCLGKPAMCSGDIDLVCGCDGYTHLNPCAAAMEGVTIDYEGECAEACFDDDDCLLKQFCAKPIGDCSGVGECLPVPVLCWDIWMPVCGCDGGTYRNICNAHRERVNVAHEGACPGGCFDSGDCPEGAYCLTPLAACDGPGECAEIPGIEVQCLDIWDPVCGCDGVTYSNVCYAVKAGVSVDYLGECIGECVENEDCPADQYCDKPIGECSGVGECLPVPVLCWDIWMPVCGCDGGTYRNSCYAHRERVNVAHEGACPGGCFDNGDCPEGAYCLTPLAACDGPGECAEIPGIEVQCLDIWDPVCGCDGVTYSNVCYAVKAGVSIDYFGECH